MNTHRIRALTLGTYPARLALAQRYNGVWGGCWRSCFHAASGGAS